jgi:short-subunit dehydrogenase
MDRTSRRSRITAQADNLNQALAVIEERIKNESDAPKAQERMSLIRTAPHAIAEEEELPGVWKKRVVVITGASSGIGLATARHFSLYADIVYNLGLSKQADDSINFIKCDITNADEVIAAIEKIYRKEGQIDILINNAGVGHSGSVESTRTEDVKRIMDVNFIGAMTAISAVVPFMREANRGTIINIACHSALKPLPFQAVYSASKSALYSASNSLRAEVRPFKIKVMTVVVGYAKTDFTENRIKNDQNDKAYKYRISKQLGACEFAEQNGLTPEYIAGKLFKLSNYQGNPRPLIILGAKENIKHFISRFLPSRFLIKRG